MKNISLKLHLNIVMMTVGTYGYVLLFLMIAEELQRDGHLIRLATPSDYEKLITDRSVKFYNLGGGPKKLSAYIIQCRGQLIPNLNWKKLVHEVFKQMAMILKMLSN